MPVHDDLDFAKCDQINYVWCRDNCPGGIEGFRNQFLGAKRDYCETRGADRVLMCWDSEGHLDMEGRCDEHGGEGGSSSTPAESSASQSAKQPSSSSSSSSLPDDRPQGCYEVVIFGRFLEGPCSSSSSSSCSSSSWCHQTAPHKLRETHDLEDDVKKLSLCFDEEGHLTQVRVCDELVWAAEEDPLTDYHPDGTPSSSSSSSSEVTAGVSIEAFAPEDESSSSSCDKSLPKSACTPLPVLRVVLSFDSEGHLFSVTNPIPKELACGVYTPCCSEPMPKVFLTTWHFFNPTFDPLGNFPFVQCVLAVYNRCVWAGTVLVPCCTPASTPGHFELSYEEYRFEIGCVKKPTGPDIPPWRICLNGNPVGVPFNMICCPIDADNAGTINRSPCQNVSFTVNFTEVPCIIECPDTDFPCDSPSSTGPTDPGGGGDPGGGL